MAGQIARSHGLRLLARSFLRNEVYKPVGVIFESLDQLANRIENELQAIPTQCSDKPSVTSPNAVSCVWTMMVRPL